ncbi:MAG TPA: hypothetical protein VFW78_02650 [Bacteroidia bacterium]|nr:hypothetical protein [Bacteroidia bacterium]
MIVEQFLAELFLKNSNEYQDALLQDQVLNIIADPEITLPHKWLFHLKQFTEKSMPNFRDEILKTLIADGMIRVNSDIQYILTEKGKSAAFHNHYLKLYFKKYRLGVFSVIVKIWGVLLGLSTLLASLVYLYDYFFPSSPPCP